MSAFKTFVMAVLSAALGVAYMTASLQADVPAKSEPQSKQEPKPTAQRAGAAEKSDTKQPVKATKAAEEHERDYYTLRAKKMLEQDKADASARPHPLAKNYPDQWVVVCEGGCKNRQAHIVDFEPRNAQKTVEVGEMIPTAAGSVQSGSGANFIACVAGCPDGDAVFYDAAGGSSNGDWDSVTSNSTSENESESGRWLGQ